LKPPFILVKKYFIVKRKLSTKFVAMSFALECGHNKITANVQGFLLRWYSVLRQPEPLLSKVNEDEYYSDARVIVSQG